MTAMSIHVVMAAASAHTVLLSCCIGRSTMITDTIPVFINKANTAVGSMVVTDAITVIVNKVRTFLRGTMIADTVPIFVNKANTAVGSMVITDAVTICIMCIGAGLSPMFRLDVAMLVLVGYLVLSIYTYISTILSGKFLLTYGSLGPTEFRLIVILINTVFMYTSLSEIKWTIEGQTLGIFDVAGLFIACFLFVAWLVQFITDRRVLSKQDPLKPYSPKK